MKTMQLCLHRAALLAVLCSGLAACGSSGKNNGPPTDGPPAPPVVVVTRQEDKFGVAFGTAFRVDPNGEPNPVADGDIIPISFTDEPTPIT